MDVANRVEELLQAAAAIYSNCSSQFPYEIGKELGQGSMGVVCQATCKNTGQQVAVKFLTLDLQASLEAKERFSRKAKAASSLDHPNISRLLDNGHAHRGPFLVSELANGGSLAKVVLDGNPWKPEVAANSCGS